MRTRLFIAVVGLVLIYSQASAQNQATGQVVIDYADGSLFQGTIISADQNTMQIRLTTGDTISMQLSMIKKMVNSGDHLMKRRGKFHYRSGYFGLVSVAVGGSSTDASAQFDAMAGYRLTERMTLGFGVAADIHDLTIGNSWSTFNYNPIYGYGRYYLNNSNWRLFADTKLGYAFANDTDFSEEHTGGMYFQPGFGFHIATKGKFKPLLSLSSLMLHTKGTSTDFWSGPTPITHNFNVWLSRVVFKIAIEFK